MICVCRKINTHPSQKYVSSDERHLKNGSKYRCVDKSLARPGRKQATATEDFEFHITYLRIIIIGGILVLFILVYITRLASKEIF